MLALYTYFINRINKETGLTEAKEKIGYYQSNNDPYSLCKTCLAKNKEDESYKMNYRRPGSAYCVPCSDLHKKENVL